MVMPILVGLDGQQKMSKSLGNYVGVTEPAGDMFAKLMSIPDRLMGNYFELLTDLPMQELAKLLNEKVTHPRDGKVALACEIVGQFWGTQAAEQAREEFFRIHGAGKSGLPVEMDEVMVAADQIDDGRIGAAALVVACGLAKSNSEARRLISEGGIRLDQQVIKDPMGKIAVANGAVLQRGKRKFVRLRLG